ncbi:MAG: FAD-dependent oxidoreductase [bacterium]
MQTKQIVVIGAGIAGLVTTLELVRAGLNVCLIDSAGSERVGGQARDAFGGMLLVGTPVQSKHKVNDSVELAWKDWCRRAEFDDIQSWGAQWGRYYIENSQEKVYQWLCDLGLSFLPMPQWVEQGWDKPGNSVPRYHLLWGTGRLLIETLIKELAAYEKQIEWYFNQKVEDFSQHQGQWILSVKNQPDLLCEHLVIASGGFGGNLQKVREQWPDDHQQPDYLLRGVPLESDGALHDVAQNQGARLCALSAMWNYPAGIQMQDAAQTAISLIPPRSALWLDSTGARIKPALMGSVDTMENCKVLARHQCSWLFLNKSIARRELAASGADMNPVFRDRNWLKMIYNLLFGSEALLGQLQKISPDILVEKDLEDLVKGMNAKQESCIDIEVLRREIKNWDLELLSEETLDRQICKLRALRLWKGDRLRLKKKPTLNDGSEWVAIRTRLVTRKSLGGICTNLNSQVMNNENKVMQGLYAVGECSGFGGGGSNGKSSLEGTFLAGCILTAQQAASTILNQQGDNK